MKNSVRERQTDKINRIVLISFSLLALFSLLSVNGLANVQEGQDLLAWSLPSPEQIEHISPDIQIVKVLLRFAENIITLNF